MQRKIAQLFRLPALLLAAALQVMPIARAALPAAQATAEVLAIVFRWAAGVAAALGGVQAVSGASTVITNPLSTNIVQGQLFVLRLTTAPQPGRLLGGSRPAHRHQPGRHQRQIILGTLRDADRHRHLRCGIDRQKFSRRRTQRDNHRESDHQHITGDRRHPARHHRPAGQPRR